MEQDFGYHIFSLGDTELYLFMFFAVMGLTVSLLMRKQGKNPIVPAYLLFGASAIFLLAGLFTPPDLISNFIFSIPSILVYAIIIAVRFNLRK